MKRSEPVLVFDLDDTLYDEFTFVRSGFAAVSDYIHGKYNIHKEAVFQLLNHLLEKKGRGRIFDDMLMDFDIFSQKEVLKCLSVYRSHKPDIRLWPEAAGCLRRFRKHRIYIVTDGNITVQRNKIMALGLEKVAVKCYLTRRYGITNSKPSPYCFMKIASREQREYSEIIHIADNVNKDFVGIKPLGFGTIRVKTGQYAGIRRDGRYEAQYSIDDLGGLTETLIMKCAGARRI